MLDLKDSELQWVIKHLGHSIDVHQTYYRCLENVIEKAKVAKLLVLCDEGRMGKFVGKKIEDIRFEGLCLPNVIVQKLCYYFVQKKVIGSTL